MRIVSPLVFAMLLASIGSAQEMPPFPATVPAIVTARFMADEAKQDLAVDAQYFYPMSNNRIGKYDKKTGKRVAQWEGSRALYPHMNSCVVDGEDLVCAASNYPAVPMSSAVEVFDTRTLRHLRSISLPPMQGSLTWIERHDGAWFAGYANYPEARGGEPGHDHRWTLLVRFDAEFRSTGSWHFPDSVLARFAPMSCSGGSWGDGGLLYVTGHDRPELNVLRLPEAGSVLDYIATIPLATGGQAIAWDRFKPRILWSLDRQTRNVVASRVPKLRLTN